MSGAAMPEVEDIEAQRELLRVYRRNLALYLQQQAEQGGSAYVTPAVVNGILDARDQIAQIKAILRGWDQAVDDHPNDMPASPAPALPETPELVPTVAAPPTAPIDPDGLEAYFTDVEQLRDAFRQLVSAPTLPKRLLVIHGVGGAGKSSLLRMFRIYARRAGVPIALASGDEVKSVVDLLERWSDDLQAAGVRLPTTAKILARYRGVQTTVERQTQKASAVAGKLALKTAEGVAGSVAGAAIGSVFPVVGTAAGAVVGALVGTGGEALSDWLSTFLKRPDIDLLLDPTRQLTDAFLADMDKAAARQRLVLLLDTFEQLSALEDWTRDLAQRLHRNVLLIIGGRAVPGWGRAWPGWLAQTRIEELKPMTPKIMRELIGRYYATMHGGMPDPTQVEAIISFARGLPVVVTSAVQLWVAYGVEDFQSVKPQVVADLVDRLLEGVPRELVPMLEAAAALRWFNKDLLRAVTQQDDVNAAYDELRRFPFIRPRAEGLALHDAVREIIDESLKVHAPERYREFHDRAATFFEGMLLKASSANAIKLRMEHLYQLIRTDEQLGIRIFQQQAEELVRFRLVGRLRELLSDVNTYLLEYESSTLWCRYYNARLIHFEARLDEAERLYRSIGDNKRAEPKLRAYALCDLGSLLRRVEKRSAAEAVQVLERIPALWSELDSKLASYLLELSGAYRRQGNWEAAFGALTQAQHFYEKTGNPYDIALIYKRIKDQYFNQGFWHEASIIRNKGMMLVSQLKEATYLKAELLRGFAVGWNSVGIYREVELSLRQALSIASNLDIEQAQPISSAIMGELGLLEGIQGRIHSAGEFFDRSNNISIALNDNSGIAHTNGNRGLISLRASQLAEAEHNLTNSINSFRRWADRWGIVRFLNYRGMLYEVKSEVELALRDYEECRGSCGPERRHVWTTALTGLVRVKHAQGHYDAISPLLNKAETLAQQREYNDHLASLRLSQAQLAWDGALPALGRGFDAALDYYKQALIYALRYNRFLLDEVLWGGGVSTPLKPIIPHCLERTFEGRRMLAALRDWWQSGVNDIGVARPDTISPIPEGITLLEAERIAREREPGDGKPQQTVVNAIEGILGEHLAGS
jgi:tetratricopeptide (TPR) repeat protein